MSSTSEEIEVEEEEIEGEEVEDGEDEEEMETEEMEEEEMDEEVYEAIKHLLMAIQAVVHMLNEFAAIIHATYIEQSAMEEIRGSTTREEQVRRDGDDANDDNGDDGDNDDRSWRRRGEDSAKKGRRDLSV
ncbi:hypothetical protein LWI29_028392 [Acer saccharum]|uniref:Uncharacterized protein n=1 Tax=Acer saccharum TaxID=4024 RepID=A0AA39SF68_ACESA|nr:hypothetical protein LWI29_028392 [Acer saccharum]